MKHPLNTQSDHLPQRGTPSDDPIAKFVRVWRLAEQITVSLSLALLLGTTAYLSLHFFA